MKRLTIIAAALAISTSAVAQPVPPGGSATAANQVIGNSSLSTIATTTATAANQTAVQAVVGAETAVQGLILDTSGNPIDWSAPVPVTDNGSSLTVDGTVGISAGSAVIGNVGVAQASTTLGQLGPLVQCAVTTSAPTYTTAQTSPLSCDTTGNVRVTGASVPTGTAGSPNAAVLSIQGITSMTPLQVGGSTPTAVAASGNAFPNTVYTTPTGGLQPAYSSSNGDAMASTASSILQQVNSVGRIFNGSNYDRVRSMANAGTAGLGVTAIGTAPCGIAACGLAPTVVTAVSNTVFSAAPANVYSVSVKAGAVAGLLMLFNSTTVPADGVVSPQACVPVAANTTLIWDATTAGIPERFTTGVSAALSSGTNCLAKVAITAEILRAKFVP